MEHKKAAAPFGTAALFNLVGLQACEEGVVFVADGVKAFFRGGVPCFLDPHIAVPQEAGAGRDEVAHG